MQETVELGDSVVARAKARGTVTDGAVPERRAVEWLAHYRAVSSGVVRIEVLALVDRS